MNIDDLFNSVPFDKFVEIQHKYKQESSTIVMTKYFHIANHVLSNNPNRPDEWYKQESLRRLQNYFKSIKPVGVK